MLLTAFTVFHVIISLIAILAGIVFTTGLLGNRLLNGWSTAFLAATIATSATGFLFPVNHFLPSHGVGIVSLLVLGVAVYARYRRRLLAGWRQTFVIGSMVAFYLNVFVGVVQAFRAIPVLQHLAPTQTESPFKVAQLGLLAAFIVVGTMATVRFRGELRPGSILS